MRDLLFDTPWWLLTFIGVIGIGLLMSGNSRQDKKLFRAGFCVIVFGIALAVVSYLVDTPREKVIKGTHALIDAAVARNGQAIAAQLHPNAALGGWNRKQIIEGAPIYADRFGLKKATITGMDVREEPTLITVTIRVVATFQSQSLPYDTVPTDWQLDWWETSDGKWLLKNVIPTGSGNLSGGQLSRQYFSAPP